MRPLFSVPLWLVLWSHTFQTTLGLLLFVFSSPTPPAPPHTLFLFPPNPLLFSRLLCVSLWDLTSFLRGCFWEQGYLQETEHRSSGHTTEGKCPAPSSLIGHLLLHSKLLTVPPHPVHILCQQLQLLWVQNDSIMSCPGFTPLRLFLCSPFSAPSCVRLPELYGDMDAPFRPETWAVICPPHFERRQASAITAPWLAFL